jgi:hypothetical protein
MSTPERYHFRKSTYSDNNASACVEVAGTLDAVRDSKNPAGPVLQVGVAALLAEIRSGRFAL